jgi:hypothetical protein
MATMTEIDGNVPDITLPVIIASSNSRKRERVFQLKLSSSPLRFFEITSTETKEETWKVPRSNKEYGKQGYWDDRFSKESNNEWLATDNDIASQLTPFLNPSDKNLVVGCGNSNFSSDLYDARFTNVVNIDFSSVVIENMRESNQDRSGMEWKVSLAGKLWFQQGCQWHRDRTARFRPNSSSMGC